MLDDSEEEYEVWNTAPIYDDVIVENFKFDPLPPDCSAVFEDYIMTKYINSTLIHKKAMAVVELNKVIECITTSTPSPVIILKILHDEFISDMWNVHKEYEEKRKNVKIVREPNTNMTCNNCGLKKIFVVQVQTRSCDEPMTQFHHCLNCGIKFKK